MFTISSLAVFDGEYLSTVPSSIGRHCTHRTDILRTGIIQFAISGFRFLLNVCMQLNSKIHSRRRRRRRQLHRRHCGPTSAISTRVAWRGMCLPSVHLSPSQHHHHHHQNRVVDGALGGGGAWIKNQFAYLSGVWLHLSSALPISGRASRQPIHIQIDILCPRLCSRLRFGKSNAYSRHPLLDAPTSKTESQNHVSKADYLYGDIILSKLWHLCDRPESRWAKKKNCGTKQKHDIRLMMSTIRRRTSTPSDDTEHSTSCASRWFSHTELTLAHTRKKTEACTPTCVCVNKWRRAYTWRTDAACADAPEGDDDNTFPMRRSRVGRTARTMSEKNTHTLRQRQRRDARGHLEIFMRLMSSEFGADR